MKILRHISALRRLERRNFTVTVNVYIESYVIDKKDFLFGSPVRLRVTAGEQSNPKKS